MQEFQYLQPLDKMERISRADFGFRLDEILEIVDKSDVGYVITNDGNDDLVLCPARWFTCAFDDMQKPVCEIIEVKIDSDLYEQVGRIFKKCRLIHEQAILLFFKECIRQGKIPFDYTMDDLLEAKRLSGEEGLA